MDSPVTKSCNQWGQKPWLRSKFFDKKYIPWDFQILKIMCTGDLVHHAPANLMKILVVWNYKIVTDSINPILSNRIWITNKPRQTKTLCVCVQSSIRLASVFTLRHRMQSDNIGQKRKWNLRVYQQTTTRNPPYQPSLELSALRKAAQK